MKGKELNWRKARASSAQNGCVEVAAAISFTGIRDSKSPERGHLAVSPEVFAVFLAGAKAGRLDMRRLTEQGSAPARHQASWG